MWNMLMRKVLPMNNGVRMAFHGTMLLLVWSVMPMLLPAAYSQPMEPVPWNRSFRPRQEASIVSVAPRLRRSARALSLAAVVSERVMKTTKVGHTVSISLATPVRMPLHSGWPQRHFGSSFAAALHLSLQ